MAQSTNKLFFLKKVDISHQFGLHDLIPFIILTELKGQAWLSSSEGPFHLVFGNDVDI